MGAQLFATYYSLAKETDKERIMNTRLALTWLTVALAYPTLGVAQSPTIIGPDGSSLKIHTGMTVKEAVQALKPERQTYELGPDSGWGLVIHDKADLKDVLLILWSQGFKDYVIDYAAKVNIITILSPKYKTQEGLYVGMLLKDAEAKVGRLKRISTVEPSFEEFAEFTKVPKGISVAVSGGILKEGERETQRYSPGARITKLVVSGF